MPHSTGDAISLNYADLIVNVHRSFARDKVCLDIDKQSFLFTPMEAEYLASMLAAKAAEVKASWTSTEGWPGATV